MARKTKADAEKTRSEIIEAARSIFHRCGVSRTSLEKVAREAGVTRGAIYWHFSDKAALFNAVREHTFEETGRVDALLVSSAIENPLDALERSICEFFELLEKSAKLRQTFEIMSLRCEYVDEFAEVLQEVNKPCHDFLAKLKTLYLAAAAKGFLRPGLNPDAMAYDTVTFTSGLFNNWLAAAPGDDFRVRARELILAHVALRRRD